MGGMMKNAIPCHATAGQSGLCFAHDFDRQRGAAVIEFAFVFPVFFVIFYAVITYGLIFAAQQSITLAAAEGARAALRYSATDEARGTNATNAAIGTGSSAYWLTPRLTVANALTTCPYSSAANNNAGVRCYRVTVTYANYRQNPLVPLLLGSLLAVAVPDKLESSAIIQLD